MGLQIKESEMIGEIKKIIVLFLFAYFMHLQSLNDGLFGLIIGCIGFSFPILVLEYKGLKSE